MKRIRMKSLGLSCFVYFDYDEFKKYHGTDSWVIDIDDVGLSAGNGIWLDIQQPEVMRWAVHEISHYLDYVFDEFFKMKNTAEATEIRARMNDYLYKEIKKIIDKEKDIM